MKERYNNRLFIMMLSLFGLCIAYRYFGHEVSKYNTTLFAFSYKYGFISRGFLGSAYGILDKLLPFNLMTYSWVYRCCIAATGLLYVLLLIFIFKAMNKCMDNQRRNIAYLSILIGMFTFPMFVTMEMLGRLDTFLMILVVLCMICILYDRCLWLVPIMCILAMLIHQGFVFTNINVILALLAYKALKSENAKKYYITFGITLLACSVLFIYFEFFSHANGTAILNEVVNNAKMLSATGDGYNPSIISHEILGQSVYEDETVYRMLAYKETIIFMIFFWPFLLLGLRFIRDLIKGQKGKDLLAYLIVALGGLTMVPEIILKVDFGRYAYYTFWYYLVVTIFMIIWQDQVVINALENVKRIIAKILPIPQLVLAYILVFVPFHDIIYGDVIDKLKIFIWG